jgi:hypothetical protein
MKHDISDYEIREALGALQCIRKHGARPDLDDLLAIAYAERRRDHEESGWQRKQMADDLGSELARMAGIDRDR